MEEYYLTRTEKAILKKIAPLISEDIKNKDIIELGNGDCSKISIILEAIPFDLRKKTNYYPVDISDTAIQESVESLKEDYPELTIKGLVADFLKHLDFLPNRKARFICFFGSTLGNLSRKRSIEFLAGLNDRMNPGDHLLLGLDMVKDVEVLEKAYNDAAGITAEFNKNIIHVINSYLGSRLDPNAFEHISFYNHEFARIEMWLKALTDMEITNPYLKEKIRIEKGETIHTENSHKFTLDHIQAFSNIPGLVIKEIYQDSNHWLSLVHFKAY